MKIIFMGTPEFALPSLLALYQHYDVVAVYTQAPKPAGRGQKEALSPVHALSNQLNIPVYTPKSLKKAEAQIEFGEIAADLAIVVAYGLILPNEILNCCKYGCINIHPSLLPFYRGAAPMQRTILAGEDKTAICIMQMDAGVDTGDILRMEEVALSKQLTYIELSEKMANLGAKLLIEVIDNIDDITPVKQPVIGSYANKITKEEGELDWHQSVDVLINKVRALNPWPGTYFIAAGEKIKVTQATGYIQEHHHELGTIVDSKNLLIACKAGLFQPLMLQRPGKKIVTLREFVNGSQAYF